MQLQGGHPEVPGASCSCPAGSRCEPAHIHVERLLLLEGDREVEVVDGCHCSAWPEECLRLPALKTFFPDSLWEVTVDVGRCSEPTYSAGMGMVEGPSSRKKGTSPAVWSAPFPAKSELTARSIGTQVCHAEPLIYRGRGLYFELGFSFPFCRCALTAQVCKCSANSFPYAWCEDGSAITLWSKEVHSNDGLEGTLGVSAPKKASKACFKAKNNSVMIKNCETEHLEMKFLF